MTPSEPPIFESSTRRPRGGSWVLGVAALAGLFILYVLRHLLLLFALAAGAAAALDPAIKHFVRRTSLPRWAIASLVFVSVLAACGVVSWWGFERARPKAEHFMADPWGKVHAFVARSFNGERLTVFGHVIEARKVSDEIMMEEQARLGADPARTLLLMGVAAAFGGVLFFVLLFYFLVQGPELARGAIKLAPPAARPRLRRIAAKAYPMLQRYFAGIFVVVAFTALATWVCIGPVFHLPHALALAVITGFLEIIPVVGPTASMTLLSIAAVMRGGSLWSLVGFGVFCFLLRFGIDQVVGPVVLGRAVRLPPVVVIFAFLAGGMLLGPLGVLIAIPSVALARIALEDYYALPPTEAI